MVSGSPINPLQNYLEFILKKIAIDLEIPVAVEEQPVRFNLENLPETAPFENYV
jgi:hypothetical protein